MQELKTERLWLGQFRSEDLDRMAEIFGDPEVEFANIRGYQLPGYTKSDRDRKCSIT